MIVIPDGRAPRQSNRAYLNSTTKNRVARRKTGRAARAPHPSAIMEREHREKERA